MSVLEKRLKTLEATVAGGDGGCGRCRGVLVTVSNAITGEIHSARGNGETLSEDELGERQTEAKCPECGRDLSGEAETVIKVGGNR